MSKKESIDHPSHYNTGGFLETIEVLRDWGIAEDFCVGNAIKYISRYKHKGNPVEDLKKARWYLDYLIKMLENNVGDK